MREIAQLLNKMRSSGGIANYALFGAAAQMRYTEPVATLDADILIDLPDGARIGARAPIEAIRVGAWPVQFIPAYSALVHEAMERADIADFEGVPFVSCAPTISWSSRSAWDVRRTSSESLPCLSRGA